MNDIAIANQSPRSTWEDRRQQNQEQAKKDRRARNIEQFRQNYGVTTGGLFNLGANLIQMRCHVWSIAPSVQDRMRRHWKCFAEALSKLHVNTLSQMTAEKVRLAVNLIEEAQTQRNPEGALADIRQIFFTVNNVFGCMPLLQWKNIEYFGPGNVLHPWTLPKMPSSSDYHKASQQPANKWLGNNRRYCVINSGAAPSIHALGKEIVAHIYRDTLNPGWVKVFRQAWAIFEDYCLYPSTDSIARMDVERFAQHLHKQANRPDATQESKIECVAVLEMLNKCLQRLRGAENWQPVGHLIDPEIVAMVPKVEDKQIAPISALPSLNALRKTPVQDNGIDDKQAVLYRMNYGLGTSMLHAGYRVLKIRSSDTEQGYKLNSLRTQSWKLWCDYAAALGVNHLSQLSIEVLQKYEDYLDTLVLQSAINAKLAALRLTNVLSTFGAIKPLRFIPTQIHKEDGQWDTSWTPPELPKMEDVLSTAQSKDYEEEVGRLLWNKGLGYGVITPMQVLAATHYSTGDDEFVAKLALTLALFLMDRDIAQLEDATEADIDAYLDNLEDRVIDGESRASFAMKSLQMINKCMPFLISTWRPRTLDLGINETPKGPSIDPLQTNVTLMVSTSQRKRRLFGRPGSMPRDAS